MNCSKDNCRNRSAFGRKLLFGCALLLLQVDFFPAWADSWQQRSPVPGARAAHSAVWTGRELIVWGGGIDGQFLNTGGRYVPATDTWRTTSPYGAPAPRWFHAAVWTGHEMIIWGGRSNFDGNNNFNDGARYDPTTDGWTSMNTEGAPTARSQCAAVWTGEEMIVWGGETEDGVPLADGAAYNPATDLWRPISNSSGLEPRMEPTAIWTGSEMIIFGGVDATQPGWLSFGNGARYDPITDAWIQIARYGGPGSRTGHTALWTGERMIVWGGRTLPADDLLGDGAIYNPGSETWTPVSTDNAPPARTLHAAVWTGTEMIVWGGLGNADGTLLNTGARYNAATGVWTLTTQENAPGKRHFWRPDLGVWTGGGMLVCAGSDYPASLDSTYLYRLVDPPCPPVIREQPQSVSVMVGNPVALSVGAGDCATAAHPSATQTSPGPEPQTFEFQTGARAGQLQFDYDFFSIPDSLRVYYDGERIFDSNLSGEGTIRVPFGPGSARSVSIVVNEDGGPASTAWEYTVSFKPAPLRYQWRKDGIVLADETNATLHFAVASLADTGDYSVVVANSSSAATSAVATLTVVPSPAQVHDLSRDFSSTHNPQGVWSYGYQSTLGGAFTLLGFRLASFGDNLVPVDSWSKNGYEPVAVYHNGTTNTSISDGGAGVFPPGTTWFYPGAGGHIDNYGVIRFTVPADGAGTYQLETSVRAYLDGARSGDTDFHILRNGVELFGEFVAGNSGTSFSNRLSLAAGDRIDFAVGRGRDGIAYDSGLKIQAALVLVTNLPPPGQYDLARDYSTTANPGGAWSFGWKSMLAGEFTLFGYHGSELDNGALIDYWLKNSGGPSSVYHNSGPVTLINNDGQGMYAPGTVWFGPGYQGNPDNFGVIRFTVPDSGSGRYRIQSVVQSSLDGPISGDTDYHVLKNGGEIFGQDLPPNSGTSFSNELVLVAGDTIDFACGRGPDGNEYASGLKIQATLTLITNMPPQVDLVINGSFEMATVAPGTIDGLNSTAIIGWTVQDIDYQGSPWVAGDGLRSLDMNGWIPGTISQEVSGFVVGHTYRLAFLMAGNPYFIPPLPAIKRLRATVGTASHEYSFDAAGRSDSDLGWISQTLDFTATSPVMALTFVSLTDGPGGAALDKISITLLTPPTNCAAAPSGLVAWWRGDGDATDRAGTNRGVLLGGTRFATGVVGRAFSFTTPSNGVKIAASPELDVGVGAGMTIELWINPDDVTQRGPLVEWNNGSDLWGAHFWILPNQSGAGLQPPSPAVAGPGQLYAAFTLLGQWYQMVTDADVLAPHVFQHVALTYDKTTGVGRIYRNGAVVAEQTLGVFTPQTSYDLYLGLRTAGPPGDPGEAYHGLLDEVSIYNRALSHEEIQSVVQAGAAGKCYDTNPPQSAIDSVSFAAGGGGLRVTGHAPPGTTCRVERSTNLVDWEPAGSTVAAASGVIEFIDSQPPTGPACFYRLFSSGR